MSVLTGRVVLHFDDDRWRCRQAARPALEASSCLRWHRHRLGRRVCTWEHVYVQVLHPAWQARPLVLGSSAARGSAPSGAAASEIEPQAGPAIRHSFLRARFPWAPSAPMAGDGHVPSRLSVRFVPGHSPSHGAQYCAGHRAFVRRLRGHDARRVPSCFVSVLVLFRDGGNQEYLQGRRPMWYHRSTTSRHFSGHRWTRRSNPVLDGSWGSAKGRRQWTPLAVYREHSQGQHSGPRPTSGPARRAS